MANGYVPPKFLKTFSKIDGSIEEFLKSFKNHDSPRDIFWVFITLTSSIQIAEISKLKGDTPICSVGWVLSFDLMTCDSYFTILVKVFTNHILAENTHIFHESCKVRRTQDSCLPQIITKLLGNVKTLKTFPLTIRSIIHFFIAQKFCKHHFSGWLKITNCKDETINHFNVYSLFD